MIVVLVKKKGVAGSPGRALIQPFSPYELARHSILRRKLPNLSPNWTAITGMDLGQRSQDPASSVTLALSQR